MDKIKIIRDAFERSKKRLEYTEQFGLIHHNTYIGIEQALQALSELETSMVSERSVDIPIANEELIKEIDRWLSVVDLELKNVLTQCKAHLSQVKPSWQPIESSPLNTWVLGFAENAKIPTAMFTIKPRINGLNAEGFGGSYYKATHWQPLPPAPEADLIKTIGE